MQDREATWRRRPYVLLTDRGLDFQGDRVREGFAGFLLLGATIFGCAHSVLSLVRCAPGFSLPDLFRSVLICGLLFGGEWLWGHAAANR